MIIQYVLFAISGILIMFGVTVQTQAILNFGMGKRVFPKLWGYIIKFSGFGLLAFLFIENKLNNIVNNLLVFVGSCVLTIFLVILAKNSSIR